MKYFSYIISVLVVSSTLFASTDYTDKNSKDKLKEYDIQKADRAHQKQLDVVNQDTQEEVERKSVYNSIPNLELLKLEIKDKEFWNHHNQNNTRDCNEYYYGDGFCDSGNNEEACTWDGGDCCPGDCVDGP